MSNLFQSLLERVIRHKVFLSYYHALDQGYRDIFERQLGHLFLSKSVGPGDIQANLATEYVKRLIREDYITDSSTVIVLVGSRTYCRKHVDWEISAGLTTKAGGRSGLVGVALPTAPRFRSGGLDYRRIPGRLVDNLVSGYAELYNFRDLLADSSLTRSAIERAFQMRTKNPSPADNSRPQMTSNTCE